MKKILIISALDIWSMGENKGAPSLWRTLKGYADSGWKVFFVTGNKSKNSIYNVHKNIKIIRFDAKWIKRLFKIKKIGFFAKIIWWFYFQITSFFIGYKIARKEKINIFYGYEVYGVPVAKILSKLWNTPMVARFQGSIVRLVWMKKPFWKLRAWNYVLAYKISSTSDLVIMTNDGSQGDRLLAQMGVNSDKVRFWINGLDVECFHLLPLIETARKLLGISHRHVLLSVSRLMRLKRVDRSIRALPEVVKDYPNTLLVIVGDGPERERLERLAKDLGVQDNVRFEGVVPHSEIPKYLAAADIFLSFYDWSNVGNPLLEAMMAGKCIISLNNGDTGKFVKNWKNGVLLDYKDLSKLPEITKRLLADEKLAQSLGANARKFAEKNFWTWEERINAELSEVNKLFKNDKQRNNF